MSKLPRILVILLCLGVIVAGVYYLAQDSPPIEPAAVDPATAWPPQLPHADVLPGPRDGDRGDGTPTTDGSTFILGPEPTSDSPGERLLHRWRELTLDRLAPPAPLTPQRPPAGFSQAAGSVLAFEPGSARARRIDVPPDQSAGHVARSLGRDGKVAIVNITLHSFALPPTRLGEIQWALANRFGGPDLGLERVADRIARIRPATVALVDSGVDFADPRLAHAAAINPAETANGLDDDANGYIDDIRGYNFRLKSARLCENPERFNHGTFIASIIAARPTGGAMDVIGLAPACPLICAESLANRPDGNPWRAEGDLAGVLEALRYAMDRGARVINLSLGARVSSEQLAELARLPIWDELAARDILLVCAAGNDHVDLDVEAVFPACLDKPNILTVMAVDAAGAAGEAPGDPLGGAMRPFSNYGARSVDIAAPGSLILGITARGDASLMSGTSFSAAYVTAAAALLRGQQPGLSAEQVIAKIVDAARPLPTLGGLCRSGGMLDVAALLK